MGYWKLARSHRFGSRSKSITGDNSPSIQQHLNLPKTAVWEVSAYLDHMVAFIAL
jgi:hypothetical protein